MERLHVNYLLIGGGLTSSMAAQRIRQIDRSGSVLLIGQEISRPYHRGELIRRYLARLCIRRELATLPDGWFTDNHVQLRTGCRATHIDADRHSVLLDTGQEASYDRLLIATGRSPTPLSIPGAQLPNIHYVRTIEQADRLLHGVDAARLEGRPHPQGRGHAVVIGGGIHAVEVAWALLRHRLHVTVLTPHAQLWHRFAGDTTGRWLGHYLNSRGIEVRTHAPVVALEGDGRAQRAVLSDGVDVPCDLVVAALGTQANRDLARNTAIAAEKAILADARARTNIPNVFAAGDCAAFFDPLFGKYRLSDHWDNAAVTGAIAGANMAGVEERYNSVSSFNTRVGELSIHGFGEARFAQRRLIRGNPSASEPDFIEIGLDEQGRVCQILAIAHETEHDILGELIRRRIAVNGNEEAIKDPSVPLQSLLWP
jgi:NADPH-dependent 2,4-dienoyl-CoA reductase/sulfur reductase-like enzyme